MKNQELIKKIKELVKSKNIQFEAFYWNSNGTNDLNIIKDNESLSGIPECLFGIRLNQDSAKIDLDLVLKSLSVSPVKTYNDALMELYTEIKGVN